MLGRDKKGTHMEQMNFSASSVLEKKEVGWPPGGGKTRFSCGPEFSSSDGALEDSLLLGSRERRIMIRVVSRVRAITRRRNVTVRPKFYRTTRYKVD